MVCAVGSFSINYFRKTKVARRRAPPEKCPPLGGPSLIKLALAKKGTGGVEGRDKKGEGGWRRGGESKNEKKVCLPSVLTLHTARAVYATMRCCAAPVWGGAGRGAPWPMAMPRAGRGGRRAPSAVGRGGARGRRGGRESKRLQPGQLGDTIGV